MRKGKVKYILAHLVRPTRNNRIYLAFARVHCSAVLAFRCADVCVLNGVELETFLFQIFLAHIRKWFWYRAIHDRTSNVPAKNKVYRSQFELVPGPFNVYVVRMGIIEKRFVD